MKMKVFGFMFALLFAVGFAVAITPFPHDFEGHVVVEDGSLTNARILMVSVDGVFVDSVKIDGDYYFLSAVNNVDESGEVEFFIGNEQAAEVFEWRWFGETYSNLTFGTVPDNVDVDGVCGDDICAVGECSFCAIDCAVVQCLGNGRCDVEIGEDYMTAVEDCTVCGDGFCSGGEDCSSCSGDCGVCDDGSDNDDGGSGSSGGGGGSSSSSSVIVLDSVVIEEEVEEVPEGFTTIGDLNAVSENDEPEGSVGFMSLITGSVIGGGASSWISALLFVVLAIVLLVVARKKVDREEEVVVHKKVKKKVKKKVAKKKAVRKKRVVKKK